MINQAIDKIKAEMAADKKPYIQVVAKFLLEQLETNPAAAEKILAADKTIKGAFKDMKDAARKNQDEGVGFFTDTEGFAIVLKYYGIEVGADLGSGQDYSVINGKTVANPSFDIKLEDLL